MSDSLSDEDLGDIYECVYDARTKWYDFGLALRIRSDILDGIKRQYSQDEECLREVLKEWLRHAPAKKRSWSAISSALRKKTVGMNKVAAKLERSYGRGEDERSPQNSVKETAVVKENMMQSVLHRLSTLESALEQERGENAVLKQRLQKVEDHLQKQKERYEKELFRLQSRVKKEEKEM